MQSRSLRIECSELCFAAVSSCNSVSRRKRAKTNATHYSKTSQKRVPTQFPDFKSRPVAPFSLFKFSTLRKRSPLISFWTCRTAARVYVCVPFVYLASQSPAGLPDCRCTKDELEPMIVGSFKLTTHTTELEVSRKRNIILVRDSTKSCLLMFEIVFRMTPFLSYVIYRLLLLLVEHCCKRHLSV